MIGAELDAVLHYHRAAGALGSHTAGALAGAAAELGLVGIVKEPHGAIGREAQLGGGQRGQAGGVAVRIAPALLVDEAVLVQPDRIALDRKSVQPQAEHTRRVIVQGLPRIEHRTADGRHRDRQEQRMHPFVARRGGARGLPALLHHLLVVVPLAGKPFAQARQVDIQRHRFRRGLCALQFGKIGALRRRGAGTQQQQRKHPAESVHPSRSSMAVSRSKPMMHHAQRAIGDHPRIDLRDRNSR